MKQSDITALSDEQLCSACSDWNGAMEELLRRHEKLVRRCARSYFLAGADGDDLIQEGMIGLLHAVTHFDPKREASFRTFATACIRHRLISAVRSAGSAKHLPLNDALPLHTFSLDAPPDEGNPPPTLQSPEELLIGREEFAEFQRRLSGVLTPLEQQTLELYLEGLSYLEIAQFLHKSTKSVDNAVQRIRHKIARLQPPASTAKPFANII